MATEVAQAKTLQERVGERIREQIGDLLTDDDLKKLVETALQDAFFKERATKRDHYSNYMDIKPPLLVEQVTKMLEEQVKKAAERWLFDHADDVRALIDKRFEAGFSKMVADVIDAGMQSAMYQFASNLKSGLIRLPG